MNQIVAALVAAFKALCYITGVVTLGALFLVTAGTVADNIVREFENKAAATAPLSAEAQEFLAIEPRTEWSEFMAETTVDRLALKFIEDAKEAGRDLDQDQIDTVYTVVAPRLRELIAQSVDRLQKDYWFWYWRGGAAREVILADREQWGPKYDGAIAEIVNR
jgi:hypothetical protein